MILADENKLSLVRNGDKILMFWAPTSVPGFDNAPRLAYWQFHCRFANQDERKFETLFF